MWRICAAIMDQFLPTPRGFQEQLVCHLMKADSLKFRSCQLSHFDVGQTATKDTVYLMYLICTVFE